MANPEAKILSETWIDKVQWVLRHLREFPGPCLHVQGTGFYVLCRTSRICGDDEKGIGVHSGSWHTCAKFENNPRDNPKPLFFWKMLIQVA